MKNLLKLSLIVMLIIFASGCSKKIHAPVDQKNRQLETMQEKQDWVYRNINSSTYWNPTRFRSYLGDYKSFNIQDIVNDRIVIRALYFRDANITISYHTKHKKTVWVYGEANIFEDQ